MTTIEAKKGLQNLHTFGIDVEAKFYKAIHKVADLQNLLPLPTPHLILGGGSNLLFTKNFDGLIVHNQIKGIEVIEEADNEVLLQVGGGESWHGLVVYCLINGFGGIENLSLIPGTVGASPIQNIGAYGVELQDVFHSLEAINLATGKVEIFNKAACQFGYRNSIFKQSLKGQYFITKVTLKLTTYEHKLQTSYGAIEQQLEAAGLMPSIDTISQAVIAIRSSKLPDPKKIGNSGSFFKNPILPKATVNKLQEQYPNMPSYPAGEQHTKVPAGWLIDQAGWKGYRKGDAGVHQDQALVLVNHGSASGDQIWQLAVAIQQDVLQKYGILIEPEVNVLG